MDFNFSNFIVAKYIAFAFLLFAGLRLISWFLPRLIKQTKTKNKLRKFMPILEVLLWLIFSLKALKTFTHQNQYVAAILFVMLLSISIWGAYFLLRDYVSGILFKSDKNLGKGERISTALGTGRITEFHRRTIQIETDKGKNILIPYTQLLNQTIERHDTGKSISGKTFQMQISAKKNISEIIPQITDEILLLPWTSLKKNPIIKTIEQNISYNTVEISVYAIDPKYFEQIETHIKKRYSNK